MKRTTGRKPLRGIIPAIVTPMKEDGALHAAALEKQAAYLCDAGVDGLFISGGTGEGAYLSLEEKKEVYRIIRDVSGGRQFLCAAFIRPGTNGVLEEMAEMASFEPDYIVAVAPFYHAMTQPEIFDHFRRIAAAAPAPLIVYNIPHTTYNPVALDTIYQLSQLENIAGVKDSSGNFSVFSRGVFDGKTESFSWIQGEDYLCGATFLAKGDGAVSGLSNARVEPYVDMYAAYKRGDWQAVRACQTRINRLYEIVHSCGNGNAAIKAATELAGRGTRWMRHASQSLTDGQVANIAAILERFDASEQAVRRGGEAV